MPAKDRQDQAGKEPAGTGIYLINRGTANRRQQPFINQIRRAILEI